MLCFGNKKKIFEAWNRIKNILFQMKHFFFYYYFDCEFSYQFLICFSSITRGLLRRRFQLGLPIHTCDFVKHFDFKYRCIHNLLIFNEFFAIFVKSMNPLRLTLTAKLQHFKKKTAGDNFSILRCVFSNLDLETTNMKFI